jgi:hypothetical protein
MRFFSALTGFNIVLFSLNVGNLATVATSVPVAPNTQMTGIDRLAIHKSQQTVIKGTGMEFILPTGFKGGATSGGFAKTMIDAVASEMPSMLPFMAALEKDPSMFKAFAIDVNSNQNPSLFLVNSLPLPANMSLEELRAGMSEGMSSILPPEFKLIDSKIVKVGSRQIVQMRVDINIKGTQIRELVGLFREGNEVFQVTYVYANKSPRQANVVFQQAIDTFKVTAEE